MAPTARSDLDWRLNCVRRRPRSERSSSATRACCTCSSPPRRQTGGSPVAAASDKPGALSAVARRSVHASSRSDGRTYALLCGTGYDLDEPECPRKPTHPRSSFPFRRSSLRPACLVPSALRPRHVYTRASAGALSPDFPPIPRLTLSLAGRRRPTPQAHRSSSARPSRRGRGRRGASLQAVSFDLDAALILLRSTEPFKVTSLAESARPHPRRGSSGPAGGLNLRYRVLWQ